MNAENVTQFSYKGNDYIILEDTVSNGGLGEWVGYIRQLTAIDEAGKVFHNFSVLPNEKTIIKSPVSCLLSAQQSIPIMFHERKTALSCLFLLFVFGIQFLGIADTVQPGTLTRAAAGIAFCNLIIYVLHLFYRKIASRSLHSDSIAPCYWNIP